MFNDVVIYKSIEFDSLSLVTGPVLCYVQFVVIVHVKIINLLGNLSDVVVFVGQLELTKRNETILVPNNSDTYTLG